MVFKVHGPDDYISDYQRHYSLRRIVERLEMGGLETKLFKSYNYDKIFCKIRCSAERLKDQAAAVDYPLLMDETEVKCRIERGFRDEFGKYKWYPRRAGWKLAGEDEEGEKIEKTFDNAIVDTEGQTGYDFNTFIYGKYDKRPDLQSPSVYVTSPHPPRPEVARGRRRSSRGAGTRRRTRSSGASTASSSSWASWRAT